MKKTLLAVSVASALLASSAVATEYEYEITPMVGGVIPEGNLDLNDHMFFGVRVAKNLSDMWFDQVELGIDAAPRVKVDHTGGKKVDIYRGLIHLVKDIPLTQSFSLYGLVGAGAEGLSDNWRSNNDRMFVDYGLGLKYRFTDKLALKAEATHEVKLNASHKDDTQNKFLFSLGLAYAFGEVAQPPVVEKVIEVEEKPVVVEKVEGDDDNDGVLNNMDECPNTPAGVPVDAKGCPQTISLHVNFNFDKANILPKYDAQINQVADFMVKYPVYSVMLEGYTDSTGSEAYNLKLSDRRAAAVAKSLINKGVDGKKVSTVGYGESNPVASNKTKEGRALNRRVDAVFSY